jgi:hypothetical protein
VAADLGDEDQGAGEVGGSEGAALQQVEVDYVHHRFRYYLWAYLEIFQETGEAFEDLKAIPASHSGRNVLIERSLDDRYFIDLFFYSSIDCGTSSNLHFLAKFGFVDDLEVEGLDMLVDVEIEGLVPLLLSEGER